MQKVVGSNPISRSRGQKMSTGNRKQRNRNQSRTSRRGRARGGDNGEGTPQAQEASKQPDGQEVSSLLETTGQEVKQLLEAADDAAKKIREAAQTEVDTDSGSGSGGGEVSTLINRTNKEVRQVLESADDAAEKIRDEARAEAAQSVDEARRRAEAVTSEHLDRVSKLTEQVLGELTGVRQQLESLRGAFDQAINAMAVEIGGETGEVWETQQNGAPEAEEDSELRKRLGRRRQRKPAQEEPDGISEGARLLALQQLMAGVDADVIEQRLKKEFGIEDPRPILQWMGLQSEKG
jgi:vacuolar-type H+-ATPase subunit H